MFFILPGFHRCLGVPTNALRPHCCCCLSWSFIFILLLVTSFVRLLLLAFAFAPFPVVVLVLLTFIPIINPVLHEVHRLGLIIRRHLNAKG